MSTDYTTISVVDGATPSNGVTPYDGASAAQVNELYGKLPRQCDINGQKYSHWRDTQRAEILGVAFHKAIGQGFIAGGKYTKTASLVAEIEVDSRFTSGGVVVRNTSAISYNEHVNGANYVWASIRRTMAPFSSGNGAVLDTYVLRLERTATLAAPSVSHSLVAIVTAAAGDITVIDDCPADKYVKAARPYYLSKSVAGSADVTLLGIEGMSEVINLTGVLTGNINVIVPLIPGLGWRVLNATTGAFTVTVKGATGTGIVVTQGSAFGLITNGTNVYHLV